MKTTYTMQSKAKGKLLSLFCFVILFATTSFTFDNQDLDPLHPENWTSLISNDLVDINYRYEICDLPSEGMRNEYLYIQVINRVNEEVVVEWDSEYWYNGNCIGCDSEGSEHHQRLVLLPNETIEGSCANFRNQSLVILSKMLHIDSNTELTDFNINSLSAIIKVQ